MKNKWFYIGVGILLALSATFVGAFSFNQKLSPAETIDAFHEKAMAGEVKESKEYLSEDILKAFDSGGFWQYGSYGNFIRDYTTRTKSVEPLEKTEKISGESATIDVKITYVDGGEETEKYFLVKEDGEWKIVE